MRIGKTLGEGASCKVKMAQDPEGNKYALKILNSNNHFKRFIDAEVETLSMINHPNIVNLIEHGEVIRGDFDSIKPCYYILLELVNGGSLFDYVAKAGRFEEKYIRHYFKQLMDGLGYLHSSGLAHRDLKLENILLDDDFNLKIADFGFADLTPGNDCSGML